MAVDLFCGLGGWTEGLLAAGFDVVGFDIERHQYPAYPGKYGDCSVAEWQQYPAQLVLQDILTVHGSQFRNASLIVASPPCQRYSWMAMPWKRAKAAAAAYRADPGLIEDELNALFNSCLRIQDEASVAAGHRIPLVIENVKGAQPWVGRAAWHYGSFYLWGDIPALMPKPGHRCAKGTGGTWFTQDNSPDTRGLKVPGMSWSGSDKPGYKAQGFNVTAVQRQHDGVKDSGEMYGTNPVRGAGIDGVKVALSGRKWFTEGLGKVSSKSSARKAASAAIAKIPFELAYHIGRVYHP